MLSQHYGKFEWSGRGLQVGIWKHMGKLFAVSILALSMIWKQSFLKRKFWREVLNYLAILFLLPHQKIILKSKINVFIFGRSFSLVVFCKCYSSCLSLTLNVTETARAPVAMSFLSLSLSVLSTLPLPFPPTVTESSYCDLDIVWKCVSRTPLNSKALLQNPLILRLFHALLTFQKVLKDQLGHSLRTFIQLCGIAVGKRITIHQRFIMLSTLAGEWSTQSFHLLHM